MKNDLAFLIYSRICIIISGHEGLEQYYNLSTGFRAKKNHKMNLHARNTANGIAVGVLS